MTNGTAAGTQQVSIGGLSGSDLTVFGNIALFNAGAHLWETDGTAAGTKPVGGGSGLLIGPDEMTVLGGEIVFTSDYEGLWVTNLTAAGMYELTGIAGARAGVVNPEDMTACNGKILFDAFDSSNLYGLWVTDGTAAGTHELTGITGASTTGSGLDPSDLTVFNGEVLFSGYDASGYEGLWITNGTAAGTRELTVTYPIKFVAYSYFNPDFTLFDGKVYFASLDTSGKLGLWVTDGTAAGTSELTGIANASSGGIHPFDLTVLGNELLFGGIDASGNYGLWVTTGTTASGVIPFTTITTADDFIGNGTSDILFRNTATGDTGFYAISNGVNTGWHDIGASSTAYQVVH